MEKITIDQYHDWWFDNAIEFLGHLLEDLDIDVAWSDGIAFDPLGEEEVRRLIEQIERLMTSKLTYQKTNNKGIVEIKNRTYLPTMHKGEYVNFLGKETDEKCKIGSYLLSCTTSNGQEVCDICSTNFTDEYDVSKVAQIIYPAVIGSLKSQCGIRKMEAEYHACPKCAFLGSIEWLDDNPFACNNENLVNYILFPKIETLSSLHRFKDVLRGSLNQSSFSNVIHGRYVNKKGVEHDKYAQDEYSLLLSLFEQMRKNIRRINNVEDIFCEDWISLKIGGNDATYKTKYTYLEEIRIPNIKILERIFNKVIAPYSNIIDKSFTKYAVGGKINNALTFENKELMSKGLILDDFKIFAQAFQLRQSCIIAGIPGENLRRLIYSWKCKNGAI